MTSKWGWKPIESLAAASAMLCAMLASIPFCSRWLIVFHQTFFLCSSEWRQSLLPLAFPREFPERSSASIREHTHTQLLFCFWNQWKWLSKVETAAAVIASKVVEAGLFQFIRSPKVSFFSLGLQSCVANFQRFSLNFPRSYKKEHHFMVQLITS